MLPDLGATELMIIAAVALIVVGPKDLPVLMRKVGQFLARMRGMAAEFRASFDEMARQSELDDLRKEVQALRSGQFMGDPAAALSAGSAEVDEVFREIGQDMSAAPEPAPLVDPFAAPVEPPGPTKPPRAPRARTAAKTKAPTTPGAKPKPKVKPKPAPGAGA